MFGGVSEKEFPFSEFGFSLVIPEKTSMHKQNPYFSCRKNRKDNE